MRGEVKRFHSANIDDLPGFWPEDLEDVGFSLQISIGPEGERGEEIFEVMVFTPGWYLRRYSEDVITSEQHTILITKYDWPAIEAYIRRVVAFVRADEWSEVAAKLHNYLGRWEFDNYRPLPDGN